MFLRHRPCRQAGSNSFTLVALLATLLCAVILPYRYPYHHHPHLPGLLLPLLASLEVVDYYLLLSLLSPELELSPFALLALVTALALLLAGPALGPKWLVWLRIIATVLVASAPYTWAACLLIGVLAPA